MIPNSNFIPLDSFFGGDGWDRCYSIGIGANRWY
jgi:hypothetical protein